MHNRIMFISNLRKGDCERWLLYHISLGVSSFYLKGEISTHKNRTIIKKLIRNKIIFPISELDEAMIDKEPTDIFCQIDTDVFLWTAPTMRSIIPLIDDFFYETYYSVWYQSSYPVSLFPWRSIERFEQLKSFSPFYGFVGDSDHKILEQPNPSYTSSPINFGSQEDFKDLDLYESQIIELRDRLK